ncbi:MAG: hypothetical protein AB7N76_36180 [Planctomycetota bacterium]
MSELLVPRDYATRERPYGPFDRDFFAEHFREGVAPGCEIFADGDVPVVELELVNGETCDVFAFEAFNLDHLVAQLFVDPPQSEALYLSFIRYETIFRINVRYYEPPRRALGFQFAKAATIEENGEAEEEGAEEEQAEEEGGEGEAASE